MEFPNTPEDNTSVIKIVNELNSYLNWPSQQTARQRLDLTFGLNSFDSSSGFFKIETPNQKASDHSFKKRLSSSVSYDEKIEQVTTKAKLSKLESDFVSLKSKSVEKDIEIEKQHKLNLLKSLKEKSIYEDVQRKFQTVVDQNEAASIELIDTKKKLQEVKQHHENEEKKWNIECRKLKSQLFEMEENHHAELSSQREKFTRQSTEVVILRNKLEELTSQLSNYKSRYEEASKIIIDYEDLKLKCLKAEQRAAVLEEDFSRLNESSFITKINQAELAKLRILQRENKILKEDNQLYRESSEKILILQETNKDLTEKLLKADETIERIRNFEFENERLKELLSQFEVADTVSGESKIRTPFEMKRIISELQQAKLLMVKEHTELKSNILLTQSSLKQCNEEYACLQDLNKELKNANEQLEEANKKLERKLALVSTEREGLRRILSSYENSPSKSQEDQAVKMEEAHSQITELSNVVAKLEKEISKYKEDKKDVEIYKQELERLQTAFDILKNEKNFLELRIQKKEIQGDYDPSKIKVICLSNNPLSAARERYHQELQMIVSENHSLRKKVIQLKQRKQEEQDDSMNVSGLIKSSKHMQETKFQLESEKMKNQRLMEQFKAKTKEFREAVYNIFGYHLKDNGNGTFKVTSVYAENIDDFFIFCDNGKSMGVTQYTEQWQQAIKDYLENGDSIPAFVASVTLELFNRQMQTRNLSVTNSSRFNA
ncbi:mitotic spindle assembly checkpoint protein MAD1 isoform X1 [Hydra vulgaris]|uniref:mitotic spindle assembly checkpoint protein MAD1 isoform X1 n=1 Tax=Hydra vulgaris TaxID=6087 RepID=UPI001F5F2F65|nr:mitotic spindle assembly checkpoint protein MAD1 [Hydra vulgaris]